MGKYWWEEDDQQTKDQQKTEKEEETSSGYWWEDGNIAKTAGSNIQNRVNTWLNNHNSYVSDYQNRYSNRKYTYEDSYVSDSQSWLNTVSNRKSSYDAEAETILSYMDQYEDYLDKDWVADIRKTIATARGTQGQILESVTKDNEYWSMFTPNEDQIAEGYTADKVYKEWQAEQKQYSADKAFDVEAGMLELEELKKEKDAYLVDQEEKRKKAESEESFWDSLGRWLGNTPDTTIPLAGVSGMSSGTSHTTEYDKRISELEAQIERSKYVQGYEGYMDNVNAEDYAANSKYISTRTDVAMADARWGFGNTMYDESKLFGDFLYDYINGNQDALDVASVNDTALDANLLGFDKGFLQTLTKDEVGVYNALYKKDKIQGTENATEFLRFIESDLKGRKRAQEQAFWAGYAKENPVGSSVFSTLISPLKGLSYLGQAADMLDDGKMEENAGYNRFSYIPSTIRSQVSNMIEKSGKWGKVGSFAYNTGMSMADFLYTTAISGGNQALSLSIMGSGAAADATLAAKDRGLDDGQAFALGTIAGLAEVAMEKISLGAWLEGDMTEGALRYILKNALSEGGEEAGTSIVNLLADVLIAGDKSEWNVAMQAYIDEGKSPEEAFGLVAAEQAAQIGLDALGGMFSGAAIGGSTYAGTSIGAAFKYGSTAKDNASSQKLVSDSLELNPENQYVQKMKTKLDNGKNLTGMQVRNILAANQEQITANDIKTIQKAAEARLTSLGQTENVAEIAEIATKWATGQEITRAEKKLITNSKYGSRVANEMLPSNIESGNYATGWAEDIGTKQVNAQAYNKTKIDQVRSIIEQMKSNEDPATYKSLEERVDDEEAFNVSKSGQATIRESGETIDLGKVEVAEFITDKKTGKVTDMVLKVDGKDVKASEIDYADGDQSYLFSAVSKIENMTPGDATVILRDYNPNSGITVGQYLNGIDEAYTYGYYGYSEADMQAGNFAIDLTKEQAKSAYMLGQNAKKNSVESDETTKKRMRTAAEGTVSPKEAVEKQKARIKSNDVEVYFQDGKSVVKFDEHTGKYDNKRKAAVNTAKFLSKLGIGGKYYFFESYVNASGDRVYKDNNGNEVEAPNGMYKDADGSIHIDLNAGDSGQGAALFTMGHELGHFVKAQSEKQFKTLSDLVTEAFDKTDMTMHERVLAKQKFLSDKRGEAVSYAEAHEEVVADALSTMLTDGSFYEKIMEIKVKDKGLFNTIKRFFDKMIAKFKKVYEELTPDQKDAQDIRAMKDMFDKIQNAFAEALVEASDNFQAAMESVVDTHAEPVEATEIITDGAVVTNGDGERYSIRSMKHDIADGKMFEDLKNVCGWTQTQVNTLKTQLKDLVEYMIPYRMILDMNETYGMEGRRFSPYKPNSDPLYKISMDFSTLCSKRLLTQYVIENLQLRENRPMSAEEQMAIRDMLNEYRKVEKGLQVACAMCYVEAARLKSPKQIQRWLDDPTPHLINYFALKNTEFNASVKKAQADFKESRGYDRNAPKKDMKQADVTALNKIGPRLRSQYQLSAEEQAIVDKAETLPNSTYLTAGNLAALSETDPVIYAAYTSFVRTATRSKSLETDEPYYYGDSTRDNGNGIIVSDSFIEAVNKENGMRFSSWSDWRIQHLLDYITAVIDNSVRGAAMHGYTKFGDEVRVLGKTGMMFNMSGVTGTQTGLNPDGSLNFSETESIDVNEAIQLREEFPENAGLQCIGVSNDHIIALLRSDIIDYVIPYHVSGLNAALRRMADIHGWKDYTGTQHATIDKSIKLENAVDKEHWHEEPVFSEFFVGYDTGMSGTEAMRASAEKYKKLCEDRGLKPKFEQFANEDNYWKLLIDRKMINQQTGNLIQQKAVTPTFDFNTIKGVVDKFVDNYDAGLEARALNHIVENWDSIPRRIKDLKKGSKTKKSVDTLANETVAAQPTKNSDRKWKPNLDSTEWGIVNYTVDHNKGTAIASTCNMFFEKSKGRTLFGIYSTDDSTLLYVSRGDTAEKERIFVELLREEYKNGNVTNTSAEGLRAWAKTVRMQRATNDDYGTGNVAPGRSAGNADLHGRPFGLYSSAALRNVLENIFKEETAGRTGDGSVKKSERSAKIAGDFADHMINIVQTKRGWYAKDVFKYVEEHPELGFIELIYAKDKDVKKLLEKFLGGIDDVKVLDQLSWYMGEAYGDKDRTWNPYDGATYPYRGAVRTFRNAIKKRINAIMTEQVGGTNLGIKNGETTLVEVKELYSKLNSNEEMKQFAEKVFATAEKLGVNIRFVNQTLSKQPVAGDNLGDMVEYKTSYFNDTTVTDQRKANTILHELIHACTVYVLDANKTMGDVSWNKSENYNRISNAATRLNRIYFEIQYDSDFQGKYGIKNVKEMVAELANEEFVGLMKKKNLWNHIVDFICELFGIDRGTSAYENARLCVDYILDNPEVSEYKAYANETRRNARYNGYDVFGQTRFSERASNKELAGMKEHKNSFQAREVRYSERGEGTSNRYLLANAFEGITQNSIEYGMIQEYKGRIKLLNEYEEKLSKLNAEIRKLTFGTEGERDSKKLKQLQDEAKKVAENINRNDKKLLSLEASEPLRKVIERERKKESQKTKEHIQQIVQNKKDRAEQTEMRHKIRRVIRDLDKVLNRGNKKQNVKEDMKGFVSKALELADYLFTDHISNDELIRRGIDAELIRGEREAQLVNETEDILTKLYDQSDSLTDEEFARLDAKRKANEDKLRDLLTAQRNKRLNTPVYNLFNDLVTEYARLKNSSQDAVKAAYNDEVERLLRTFIGDSDSDRTKALQNMRVADMTTEELWKLYNAYTMVLTTVRDANKFHVKGMNESIEQVVGRIAGDFSSRKIPDKKLAIAAQKLANKIGWDYEKLYYALDRIGSESFTELIMNLADSENTVMQDIIEAATFRDKIVEKYGFNNWDVNKKIDREFLDNTGKKFKLTLGELMSLYAYSRREGAWDHIEYGGFVFGKKALTDPKPADSYKLSKEQCEAITSLLTKEQKGYVEDMQKFLSETMGAKGNEVSMMLYGIKMFGEKNYFPIHIAGQFKAQAQESQAKQAAGFGSMSNAGFTHEQNPNAKAPFVLEGFNEVWSDHVNEMSRYHGTVPALEDIRRVMNRSTYSDSVAESQSIKQLMENSYGKEAVDYFDNIYREANSGAITDKLQKKSKKLLNLFRKNSVAYSLSVLIQQPASLVRAYALIDKKYFGFKGFGTITSGVAKAVSNKWTKAHTNAYNEMLQYAPGVTMAKEIGGFDTAIGGSIRSYLLDTNKSIKQKWNTENALGKGKAVLDLVDNNAIANLPNVADKIAWIEIWNACKRETVATHKNLAPNSEAFMQAVGERFTEVIRATQVYDSIFAKSPMLKSKNLAVQYLVSFMNEPNTIANMVESAVRSATRGNWKQGARTAAVVVHSIIFTNVLKSIIYAMRDDDEDETYIEKYIEAITGGMMDDFWPLNYIPIARDAWSIAKGYDVERADMAIVADALDALDRVFKNVAKDTEDMTEEELAEFDKKVTDANWRLAESVAAFFGIPIKNVRREIVAVIDHAKIAYSNAGKTTKSSAWDTIGDAIVDSIPFMSTPSKQDKLYDAIISGDKDYLARLKSTYKTDSAYNSTVRKALRENDSRIHEAAQARYDGNAEGYKRIFREIKNEGKFTFDEIMGAINSEENAIRNKLEPEKATSNYSTSDFVEAVSMGDTETASVAMSDIISTHVANGKTQEEAENAFASAVSTSAHEAYFSGLLGDAGAKNMLMEYADMDEDEASSKVNYWAFMEGYPGYELSESNVNDYTEFAEPAGINLDIFTQYVEGTKGLVTIYDDWGNEVKSKREQVLDVIDSLPLTWQQKDALYLAAGYSESKIWDVPW